MFCVLFCDSSHRYLIFCVLSLKMSSSHKSANFPASCKWEIDNFANVTTSTCASEAFNSPSTSGIYFHLWLHPTFSLYQMQNTHTVIVLSLFSGDVPLPVRYQLSILGANREKHNTRDFSVEFSNKNTIDTQYILSRDYLTNPANGLLVNGKLTIYYEVYLLNKVVPTLDSEISQDYGLLLENGKLSDVTLAVGEKAFKAHKVVLAARSPVFCAMFEHSDTKESKENRVDIGDISVEVFEQLLHFIYTGQVDSLDSYPAELLQAADMYQMDSLKATCEQYLCTSLTIESFASIAVIADMHGAAKLQKQCIDYLIKHAKEVIKTDGWKKLIESRSQLGFQLLHYVIDKI